MFDGPTYFFDNGTWLQKKYCNDYQLIYNGHIYTLN